MKTPKFRDLLTLAVVASAAQGGHSADARPGSLVPSSQSDRTVGPQADGSIVASNNPAPAMRHTASAASTNRDHG
ncbi:MAG: hypothetical protein FWD17_20050 [Polyangiaceae bacterium]|nr:hypothetical protein [Polyangiaceae bacterium]